MQREVRLHVVAIDVAGLADDLGVEVCQQLAFALVIDTVGSVIFNRVLHAGNPFNSD